MKLIIEYHMKNSEHLNEHHVTQEWRTLKNIQNEIMELKDLQILLQLMDANDGMRAAVIQLNLPMNEHNHLLIRMYNRYLIFENKRGRLNKLNDMK